MHKRFKLFVALIIAVFVLPVLGQTVLADAGDIKSGEYTIEVEALNATDDTVSGAANFISKQASFLVKDGKFQIVIAIPHIDMAQISGLQIEGKGPTTKKEVGNATHMTYDLASLESILNARVQYVVPAMNIDHDVPLRFKLKGLDALPVEEEVVEEPTEEPEDTEVPKDEEEVESEDPKDEEEVDSEDPKDEEEVESEDPKDEEEVESEDPEEEPSVSIIKLKNGFYTIDTSFLQVDTDKASSMGSYIGKSAFLSVQNGRVMVTITILDNETVTDFQVNGKNAVETVIDGNKRYETFELDSLASLENAHVKYQAPYQGDIHKGQADFRIYLAEASVKAAVATDQPGESVAKPDTPEKPVEKPDTPVDKEEDSNLPDNTDKDEKSGLTPDKVYEIDYTIKHGIDDKVSSADSFFKKPAFLLYKDGEAYIQLTVTNSDMIKSLSTSNGDVIVVRENADGSMVVQFKVGSDLSDFIGLDMHITVPGMYSMDHSARLFLDVSSQKEVAVSDYLLVAGSKDNKNGPLISGEKPGGIIDGTIDETINGNTNAGNANDEDKVNKPNFDSNGTNSELSVNDNTKQTKNPQTGDTSSILMYTFLLLGSLLPLAIKYRRRFN